MHAPTEAEPRVDDRIDRVVGSGRLYMYEYLVGSYEGFTPMAGSVGIWYTYTYYLMLPIYYVRTDSM